ncbi:MAG: GIY-YIG nuclease family protein, partial [bacterium]|nr:GIY-YIG nuclease family protein [Gammaproteobacteria bacterium]HIL98088.1 GIY-YIG nuclease family protein [Pseudomonadales bacterium]
MNTNSGTYVLILGCDRRKRVQVGRWDTVQLERGFYIYVGSAFGPGGVKARVSRHCRKNKKHHWHIDYIREFLLPLGAWYLHGSEYLEHSWADSLASLDGYCSIPGFGCSDCKCDSHLFHSINKPDVKEFSKAAGCSVEYWCC